MECSICKRLHSRKLPFKCAECVRETIYQPRIQQAQVLLEKEDLGKEIEGIFDDTKGTGKPEPLSKDQKDRKAAWTLQSLQREKAASEDKTQTILPQVDLLRTQIGELKADIALRRAALEQRRNALDTAKEELDRAQATATEPLHKGIRRTHNRWDLLHKRLVESRLFLSKEAADLAGLRRHPRKRASATHSRDIYSIGGTPIIDLRDLNSCSPATVTASNTRLARLVHLISHYLSLKLPAEITLPHNDYPHPTIFSPTSSYSAAQQVSFPGTTPPHSLSTSPTASRHKSGKSSDQQQRNPSQPRILHLEKPLPVLAKEDQMLYASFVEGTTFLAWNIAWLCRTQGMPVATSSWEDVCGMGRNLYELIFADRSVHADITPTGTAPPPSKAGADNDKSTVPQTITASSSSTTDVPPTSTTPLPPAAHFSHATSYAFLGTGQGMEYMSRGWKVTSPVKTVERVKAMLLSERQGAEWEVVDGQEWNEFDEDTSKASAQQKNAPSRDRASPGSADGSGGRPQSHSKHSLAGHSLTSLMDDTGVLIPRTSTGSATAKDDATVRRRLAEMRLAAREKDVRAEREQTRQGEGGVREKGWMKVKSRRTESADTPPPA